MLTFSEINLSKNSFRNTIRVSNVLDPDQEQHFDGPDLGLNCLQRLSEYDKSPIARKELSSLIFEKYCLLIFECSGKVHLDIDCIIV